MTMQRINGTGKNCIYRLRETSFATFADIHKVTQTYTAVTFVCIENCHLARLLVSR